VAEDVHHEGGAMTTTTRTIHVAPGSELDRLLVESAGEVVVLERDWTQRHLNLIDAAPAVDVWANDDSEKADAAVVARHGTLSDVAAQRARDSSGEPW
jgi:hypothetical protein